MLSNSVAKLGDTVTLLGHDVMDFAYDGDQQLKLPGSADNSLDEMRRDIGAPFTRTRRRPSLTPEPAATG